MENKNFMTYEYLSKLVKKENQASTIDIYISLGFEVTKVDYVKNKVLINLRRDRKIKHKTELNRLEKRITNELVTVDNLKNVRTKKARMISIIIGIIGSLILGGGMSLVMKVETLNVLFIIGIIVGSIGIIICSINYLIYLKIKNRKHEEIEQKIEESYTKIANICEQAHLLIIDKEF